MLRFDVVTLFPDLFAPHLNQGVTRRAFGASIDVRLWPLRDFSEDPGRRVDDRPFGGGPGMVLLAEPLLRAVAAAQAERAERAPVVFFTPGGRPLDQEAVRGWAAGRGAILVCGRYEGVDQRFVDACVTHEVSLGDFVLSGGEIPALALLDAVARLQDGVLPAPSHEQDSFSDGLIEGPAYSRPERLTIDGTEAAVPAVLLSGHHGRIEGWRRARALERTARRRPDLIERARRQGLLSAADEATLRALGL